MPLLLSERDVRDVLSMDDLIAAMETALAQFSNGGVEQPVRTVLQVGDGHAFYGIMPAFVREPAALGTKLVTVYGSNESRGLPSHLATIVLLDPATGGLLAILDGRFITEARTAAASAVSVKRLARADARTLAIFGSGVQAGSHLDALMRVRAITEVRVWSRRFEHADAFVRDRQGTLAATIRAERSAEAAAEGADVIALVTAAHEPVLRSEWVADGTHVCAVGACRPDQREMETALVRRGRVFVDSLAAARTEAGDLVIPLREKAFDLSHVQGELGAVVAGRLAGRTGPAEVTIFKSLGLAVEDVAAARLAWERASAHGLGREFSL
ncbi:MAG TPA: ornithine cyclodeaminase family protein [Vicinamibacterales bacterium]|nr:ornithine cyclodeaminase family protein [Vicinamibacterales bacterium]